ncbi:hypothetical protein SAMN05216360_10399 [Methylobacterium phyllostachyos]|uniref:Uncharacterized protein n=1 Tax=Methylobacterium phyllostachyos TaxID=582672 RepID=A0A1G9V7U4_9HYPH|nr:hypothetical protein [Methylobacterium phyllostachyos]SDM68229.1 hypothetical protein SAMN05216360_10399 [Methylobacterium phyllostachyos]
MTRREYTLDVWLPENGPWLALVSVIVGCLTAPEEASAARQALAWMLASVGWFALFLVLVGVVWRPWAAPPEAEPPEEEEVRVTTGKIVPLRPSRPDKGLH